MNLLGPKKEMLVHYNFGKKKVSNLVNNILLNQEFSLESIIEGIMYLLSEPITLDRLSLATKSDIEQIQDVIGILQDKYEQMKDPFYIEHTLDEKTQMSTVELKLRDDELKKLQSYSFISNQELPTKYFRVMSVLMNIEYISNEKVDKKILKKELKLDQRDLDKILGVLLQFGYLKRKNNLFFTSDSFLRRMGFPTDKKLVKSMLKERTIEFTLQYYGFNNGQD